MRRHYYNSYVPVLLQDENLSSSDPSDLLSCSVYSTVYQPTLCWDFPQPSAEHVSLLVPTGNILTNTRYVSFPLSVALIRWDPLEGLLTQSLTKPRWVEAIYALMAATKCNFAHQKNNGLGCCATVTCAVAVISLKLAFRDAF